MKEKVKGFLSGIACGGAVSVPGVSWGTILVATGYYDRICEALALNFKTIKENFLFFGIFLLGLGSGIFGFAQIITMMIGDPELPPQGNLSRMIFYLILCVLIACCLPTIFKKAYAEKKFMPKYLIPIVLGAALIVTLFIAEWLEVEGISTAPGPIRLFVCSVFAGLASIIPGISGSFVLVILGTYETVINAVADFDFRILVFAGAGTVTGFVGGSRLITYLLKKYHETVYSAIIGMVVASTVMLAIDSVMQYG